MGKSICCGNPQKPTVKGIRCNPVVIVFFSAVHRLYIASLSFLTFFWIPNSDSPVCAPPKKKKKLFFLPALQHHIGQAVFTSPECEVQRLESISDKLYFFMKSTTIKRKTPQDISYLTCKNMDFPSKIPHMSLD